MATREAAQVLLWDKAIGSLEVGKRADIAILRGDKLRLSPHDDPQAALVRQAVGEDIETVMIDGRIVVDGGTVSTLDEVALLQEATKIYAKLGSVLKPRRYRATLG
jgi:5-methylthioadenosine/S-adenosylhomocysteine deaminase